MINILVIILGLCVFEIISSIDNAIFNASVLVRMSIKARKWFLVWGVLVAVFVVRGLLPWVILYMVYPQAGLMGSFLAAFNGDTRLEHTITLASPRLYLAGGVFLLFLFLHWIFLEETNNVFNVERYVHRHGVWFFAVASLTLSLMVWYALQSDQYLAFAAVVGASAYFIVHGFREQSEKSETSISQKNKSGEISKLLYLIIIDAIFSLDGVLGAFAFTLSVPLILIGNGVGAFVVAWLTVNKAEQLKKYYYLKDGAMYSIGILGIVMSLRGYGYSYPDWLSPVLIISIIIYFFWRSIKNNRLDNKKI